MKDEQDRAIQIRHVKIITYKLFYLVDDMLEKQPGEPISLIYRPGKEFSDKMETRVGGTQRLLPSLFHRTGMSIIN